MKTTGIDPSRLLVAMLLRDGIPTPETEWRFHGERKWRFDYAWPAYRVALEVEGGVFGYTDPKTGQRRQGGAHGSITGIKRDMEKYNYAAAMGWLVIRCLPTTLHKSETIGFVLAALKAHGWNRNTLPA